jgi:hypothetical protein
MIERCGLDSTILFSAYLSVHLRRSRQDPKLLSLLREMKGITYGGLFMAREDEDWAEQNGINIRACFRPSTRNSSSD